ncbi:MAG: tetratricopeptide repeat protein, partial [Elusimicrobiales bacterium]|nr:tetratricopeptide repeat protein [Elusimicrobiales bacterium]
AAGRSPAAADAARAQTDKKLTLRFRNIKIPDLLGFLSKTTGLSFRIEDGDIADMKVTVYAKQTNAAELMEMLTKFKDLEFAPQSGAPGAYAVRRAAKPAPWLPLSQRELAADERLRTEMSIRLKDAPLPTLLDIVSEKAKLNFMVLQNAADTRISVSLTRATAADILQFLRSRGFEYSRVADSNIFLVRKAGASADRFSDAERAFNDKEYQKSAAIYADLAAAHPGSDMADYALLMSAVSYDWLAGRDGSAKALRSEEETLLKLIKAYPSSTRLGDAYLYLGNIHSGNAGLAPEKIDCKKAIRYYDLAMKGTYRPWVKAQAMVRTGQCHALAGDEKKAREIYAEAAKKYPDEAIVKAFLPDGQKAMLEIGIRLEEMGEYELALKVYEAAEKKDSTPETSGELKLRLEACRRRASGSR